MGAPQAGRTNAEADLGLRVQTPAPHTIARCKGKEKQMLGLTIIVGLMALDLVGTIAVACWMAGRKYGSR